MHNNYFFLKWLVADLQANWVGAVITEVFSQEKDVLQIGLKKDGFYWIKAHLKGDFSCLSFPDSIARAKRNTANIFPSIAGLQIERFEMVRNDRSFYIYLSNDSFLVFKMHGNRSNVLLGSKGKVQELFKNSLARDLELDLNTLPKPDPQLTDPEVVEGDINKIFPVLGRENTEELMGRGWDSWTIDEKRKGWEELILELESLSKVNLHHSDHGYSLSFFGEGEEFDSPRAALTRFFVSYQKETHFKKKRTRLLTDTDQQIRKTHTYLQKTKKQLKKIREGFSDSDKADLIMANLHMFTSGVMEQELMSFDGEHTVKVKLKQGQSAAQHAQNLYRKSKNRKIEVDTTEKNILAKEKALEELLRKKEIIEQAEDIRALDDFGIPQKSKQKEVETTYLEYELDGFTILVGRNAKNNDKLTFDKGYKEDMWLHVKDARGSHVLIKYRSDRKFPEFVIEKAAQLAAWFSKRKTEALVPVIFTPRKFIRKRKGDPAGAVVVDQEKVILVNPENW